jgi:hypothetical protein
MSTMRTAMTAGCLALLALTAGCASEGSDSVTSKGSTPPSTPNSKEECDTERRTVEVAIEAYFAQYGHYAAHAKDLVEGGILRKLPRGHEVTDDKLRAIGPCA